MDKIFSRWITKINTLFVQKLWYPENEITNWRYYFCYPLFYPLSCLFGYLANKRKQNYLSGQRERYQASIPVIIVGNINVGGTGKTPIVIMLVTLLKQLGYHPAVISRGYGGQSKHYPLLLQPEQLSNVSYLSNRAELCGDEPILICHRAQVTVGIAPKRADAIKLLLEQVPLIDIIISDDGLQHYALQRDVELVVIDGQRRFGNGQLLPLGPMRESQQRLATVNATFCNGGHPKLGELGFQLRPTQLVNLKTNQCLLIDNMNEFSLFQSEFFAHKQWVAMAGIGNPQRFFDSLRRLNCPMVHHIIFSDHQHYNLLMLQSLATKEQLLIMTEKDAVKCQSFAQDNWWYLAVDAVIDEKNKALLLSLLLSKIAH